MKNTSACPKCKSRDIIRIAGYVGGHGSGNNIYMGWFKKYLKVPRYVCGNCGFTEEWIDSKKDIEKLRKRSVKI